MNDKKIQAWYEKLSPTPKIFIAESKNTLPFKARTKKYSIVSYRLDNGNYVITFKISDNLELSEMLATEIAQNLELIKQFDSLDAYRIGYFAGIMQTSHEFKLKNRNRD